MDGSYHKASTAEEAGNGGTSVGHTRAAGKPPEAYEPADPMNVGLSLRMGNMMYLHM